MKAYESKNAVAIRKRVKKVHAKAKFVGVLYLLGALAMAALACFPMLNIGGEDLWVLTCWNPFATLFKPERNLLAVLVSVLFLIAVLVCVINLFRCFSKLGWLTKRSFKYVNGYNRNMRAMDDMGKLFSGSFATIITLHFLIYLLQPSDAQIAFTLYTYIMLGAGLFIHFLAGLIGGTVSYFNVGGPGGNVEEEKRTCGLFVYFFRNLVQLAAVAGMLYFFVKNSVLGGTVSALLSSQNPFAGDIVKDVLPIGLHFLLVIWLIVLIKHATASTEFNRLGIEGAGMHNFKVFSMFVFITAGGAFVIDYLKTQPDFKVDFLIIAGIALVAFLVDCIFKSKKKEEEVTAEDEGHMNEYPFPMPPMPQQVIQPMPVQTQQGTSYQPIYIPIYYPVYNNNGPVCRPACQMPGYRMPYQGMQPSCAAPAPMPAPAPAAAPCNAPTSNNVTARPAPAPAPANLKPMPSPQAQAQEGKNQLREQRRDIAERQKVLKREQATAKTNKKIAQQNKKADAKLKKQEAAFAKKEAAYAKKHAAKASDISGVTATRIEPTTAAPVKPVPETKAQPAVKPAEPAPAVNAPVEQTAPVAKNTANQAPLGNVTNNVHNVHNVYNAANAPEKEETQEPKRRQIVLDPKKTWKVRCPKCGKELQVRETSPYHRCPACDKIFQIEKIETLKKKED